MAEVDQKAQQRRAQEAECLLTMQEEPGPPCPVQPTPRTMQIEQLQRELTELKQGPVFKLQAAVLSVQNSTAEVYAESVAPALEQATAACTDAASTVSTKLAETYDRHEPDLAIASARIGGAFEQFAEAAAPAAASAGEFISQAAQKGGEAAYTGAGYALDGLGKVRDAIAPAVGSASAVVSEQVLPKISQSAGNQSSTNWL